MSLPDYHRHHWISMAGLYLRNSVDYHRSHRPLHRIHYHRRRCCDCWCSKSASAVTAVGCDDANSADWRTMICDSFRNCNRCWRNASYPLDNCYSLRRMAASDRTDGSCCYSYWMLSIPPSVAAVWWLAVDNSRSSLLCHLEGWCLLIRLNVNSGWREAYESGVPKCSPTRSPRWLSKQSRTRATFHFSNDTPNEICLTTRRTWFFISSIVNLGGSQFHFQFQKKLMNAWMKWRRHITHIQSFLVFVM